MIYLASPYSNPDYFIREQRFLLTRRFVAAQLSMGHTVFSPIVYAHQFALEFEAPTSAEGWYNHNMEWLGRSSELWILTLPGWKESIGVGEEVERAFSLGLPVSTRKPLE